MPPLVPPTWVVLARAFHSVAGAIARETSRHGLTLAQFAVLEALANKGSLPLGRLGQLLVVTPGNITYVVNQLERRGLVRRERAADDRRVVSAALTPEGRELVEAIAPEHARFVRDLFAVLTPAERAVLRRLLKKLGLAASATTMRSRATRRR